MLRKQAKLPKGAYAKSFEEAIEPYASKNIRQEFFWRNLLTNHCPKCNKSFVGGTKTVKRSDQDKLMVHECGFKIKESKMTQIVANLTYRSIEDAHIGEKE